MVDYGGKSFRRKLLQNLIADEDDEVLDELIFEQLLKSGSILNEEMAKKSCADEEFTSCDESSDEQDGRSLWMNKNADVFDQRTPQRTY